MKPVQTNHAAGMDKLQNVFLSESDIKDTYQDLRYVFGLALAMPDLSGPRHQLALSNVFDLLTTLETIVNPDLR
jgi:hypothetical protein